MLLAFQFRTPEWVIGIASAALTASAATPPLILINHRLAVVASFAIAPDSSWRRDPRRTSFLRAELR
jgi:hypothetical protein